MKAASAAALPASLPAAPAPRLGAAALVAYGSFGVPLAMAALPVYVHLPRYYGGELGVDLALLGLLLLALRLLDGAADPLIGAWSDRLRSRRAAVVCAAPVLAVAMIALFMPVPRGQGPLLLWLGIALAAMYFAYSVATINHNAWGAELSADPVERTRITAVREGLALGGVVFASIAPDALGRAGVPGSGLAAYALCFAAITLACALALARAPSPPRPRVPAGDVWKDLRVPLADSLFRRLLAAFLANGIASAIPATLVLFYIADVLGAEARQGMFLATYFVAGALGMPLWVRLSARIGKARTWAIAMAAATLAFVWAWRLGPGDDAAFAIVCAISGLALGADLALPPSLLADVVERGGNARATGAYFGVWTLATKLNLALAAGIALPLLAALGYTPGTRGGEGTAALALVYAAVPCALKLGALGALQGFRRAAARANAGLA